MSLVAILKAQVSRCILFDGGTVCEANCVAADPSVTWVVGDAEQLPFEDASMDAYTIAFGIRNCTHIDKVIKVFSSPLAMHHTTHNTD